MFTTLFALPVFVQIILALVVIGVAYVFIGVTFCNKNNPNPLARAMLKIYWKPDWKIKACSFLLYSVIAGILYQYYGVVAVYAMLGYALVDVGMYVMVRLITRNYGYVKYMHQVQG